MMHGAGTLWRLSSAPTPPPGPLLAEVRPQPVQAERLEPADEQQGRQRPGRGGKSRRRRWWLSMCGLGGGRSGSGGMTE